MRQRRERCRLGELRPSQLMHTFGVGAVVDLPEISALVMGLDDWKPAPHGEIVEERLLAAVREVLGSQVERLYAPPHMPDLGDLPVSPLDPEALIGVPVAPFPRWLRCPYCDVLAPLNAGFFQLKTDPYRPDRTRYVHANCRKPGQPPAAVPARFLTACRRGHLDDFPWVHYVHRGDSCEAPALRLREQGASGDPDDIWVICESCKKTRPLADALGDRAAEALPSCRGRRPHLRDFETAPCTERVETIALGASNSWFSLTLNAFSIPRAVDPLGGQVERHWAVLEKVTSREVLAAFRAIGQLPAFAAYSDDAIWTAIEAKRAGSAAEEQSRNRDLKAPEWEVLSQPQQAPDSPDFRLREVPVPEPFGDRIERVVLVERLREVQSLLGFTRLVSPGDFGEQAEVPPEQRVPLSRHAPRWAPAAEVRGEGIFLQFSEEAVREWESRVGGHDLAFRAAHELWRSQRHLDPHVGYPGLRLCLLHSLSHALMRQFALESGYSAAGIRERIYSRAPVEEGGPMAGILLYTAAPDSEGTLGGLVRLGETRTLGRQLLLALEQLRVCTSDPLCAEHRPVEEGVTLHGAACHACLFAPETSCERGNRYLDRSVLIPTLAGDEAAFFTLPGE